MGPVPDPSRSSFYIDEAFYEELVTAFSDWQHEEHAVQDPALREACRMVLEREARLLDQHRYENWLAMYAAECLYWVPATPDGGDPRHEVAVAFDDRRRLEDRVFRLRTGFAWSQTPVSRTTHFVSNVEVFAQDRDAPLMVRSNLMVSELRGGETRTLSGWCAHRLAPRNDGWEILVKQVNLLECDRNLRNPSLIL